VLGLQKAVKENLAKRLLKQPIRAKKEEWRQTSPSKVSKLEENVCTMRSVVNGKSRKRGRRKNEKKNLQVPDGDKGRRRTATSIEI